MNRLLAQNPFGKVTNPAGTVGNNPAADLGGVIAGGILMMFAVAGLAALGYGMWGALNWVMAGGDKEKLRAAQGKIRDALLGVIMLVVVLAIFATLFQVVLGGKIIKIENGAIKFTLPTIDGKGAPATGPGGGPGGGLCPGCAP